MEFLTVLLIVVCGLMAGFINTVAGGGSLLTLPLLLFLGLPAPMANGTNRIAIVVQNIFAVSGFRSKGVGVFPYSWWVALAALPGAVLGAWLALDVRGEVFNRILAVIIVGAIVMMLARPKNKAPRPENLSASRQGVGVLLFFLVGIYGGFIQAGVGFLILAVLGGVNHMGLVRANSVKVFVVLLYTLGALALFIAQGQVNWYYGLSLAVGNATGGWVASRLSVKKGDKWVRNILIIMLVAMAVKLFFF